MLIIAPFTSDLDRKAKNCNRLSAFPSVNLKWKVTQKSCVRYHFLTENKKA